MSEHLWELIHEMSPTEKSFFKKNVQSKQSKEDPLYLKMFNSLNAMSKYSEKQFAHQFGKGNQVSRMKTYLYELLLASLIEISNHSDNILRSKKSLNSSWILFQKGLFNQSLKMVEKAQEQAVLNADLYTEAEALSLKRLLNFTALDIQGVSEIIKEESRVRELILEIQEFELLCNSFTAFSFTKGNIINTEERNLLNTLVNDPRLQSIENCNSNISRSYFYRILTLYFGMIGEYEKMYDNALSRYNLLKETLNSLLNTQNFINSLNNLIEACLITDRLQDAIDYNIELIELRTPSTYFEARKHIRYTILNLQIMIKSNNKEMEAESILKKDLVLCFHKYDRFVRTDEKLEILFLIITYYFNRRLFKDCKLFLKQYYVLPRTKTRVDLQLFIMIINIYMNFLSSDLDHLNYLIRNIERFERNEKILDTYERKLLDLIKLEIVQVRNSVSDKSNLFTLKDKLSVIQYQRNEMSMAKYIQF